VYVALHALARDRGGSASRNSAEPPLKCCIIVNKHLGNYPSYIYIGYEDAALGTWFCFRLQVKWGPDVTGRRIEPGLVTRTVDQY
jgi:hypothetical protein